MSELITYLVFDKDYKFVTNYCPECKSIVPSCEPNQGGIKSMSRVWVVRRTNKGIKR